MIALRMLIVTAAAGLVCGLSADACDAGTEAAGTKRSAAKPQSKNKIEPAKPSTAPAAPSPAAAAPVKPTTPAPEPNTWSEAELKAARENCRIALKGVTADMVREAPIKSGQCGSPVVYKVMSISSSPAVALVPPATLSCEMVGALHTWIKQDLQPLARRHLGGPLVKMINMSSYSCRNAYGRKASRLSEHGRANALDIAGFETVKTGPTLVLNTWGPTARQIRALAAKAEAERKAAADKAAAARVKAARSKAAEPPGSTAAAGSSAGMGTGHRIRPAGVPGLVIQLPSPGDATSSAFGKPSQLGGPGERPGEKHRPRDRSQTAKGGDKAIPKTKRSSVSSPVDLLSRQTMFIRKAHETACNRFRTALGPEANRAHENHFHVDMAERSNGSSYCE